MRREGTNSTMSVPARADRARLTVIPGGSESSVRPVDRDDAQLISAALEGAPGAAAALHDRVRPAVDRTLRRLIGSRDADYADLAQNALIEIAATLDRFRGECALDSWASTITSRLVYKQFRRRAFERRHFSALEDDHAEVTAVAPARAANAKRMLERVIDHLRAMDPQRSWAYWLHDVCGHDLREVAEIMNVSVAAAQSRLVRGRKELRERIHGDPQLARGLEEIDT